jgi:hypothetical protein
MILFSGYHNLNEPSGETDKTYSAALESGLKVKART